MKSPYGDQFVGQKPGLAAGEHLEVIEQRGRRLTGDGVSKAKLRLPFLMRRCPGEYSRPAGLINGIEESAGRVTSLPAGCGTVKREHPGVTLSVLRSS